MDLKYPNIEYNLIPHHMKDGAQNYIEHGIEPGGFLFAALTNDLAGAFQRADHINERAMKTWATWLYFQAPHDSWGSHEKVLAWMDARAKERMEQDGRSGS